MKIYKDEKGLIEITGDETVVVRTEGKDVSSVDISNVRITADNLADFYNVAAQRKDEESALKCVALKQKYLETFGTNVE
ncbi:hypothetical protein [Calidifontibacillus erzurumensis]|uniref:Uncharacterized protein n=1 Tax=Calidifontibacillus erzurumensis TaxID=2741433 RepID=A0A8J8GH46_9BACI|nr:hypothetical protein [Calidifontibacillus erzurumensis]NSL51703.1 hypothetical protein [Calidifontibacillus erzurumensis]